MSVNELSEIRRVFDGLDSLLVSLLSMRTDYAHDAAEYKFAHSLDVYQPEREVIVVERLRKQAVEQGLDPDFIGEIMQVVFKYSKAKQEEYFLEKIKGDPYLFLEIKKAPPR